MANGDVVNFDRYGSTTPEESEMKTLDIVMSTEANHNPHYRLQSNHHPNHLPNSLTPATMTSTSTAGTSTCDGDLRPRRPPANGGNNSGGRNVWRVLSGGYRGLRDRCHQQNNNNNLLSVCTRIFLIVVNFLFLVSGWALFGLGVWLHVYRESFLYAALFKDNPTSPMIVTDRVSLLMIGVGGFVVTVCFLGCCGACTDSVCFLAFYALMLMIAILLQICLASLAPTFRQQILESLANSMQYQIKHEYNSTAEPYNGTDSSYNLLTAAWDTLQIKLGCCGARGPIDYQYSSWFNHTTYTEGEFVPSSCCVLFNVDHTKPVYKDEAQCQIEALAAIFNYPNKTRVVDDDHDSYHANIQGCHTAIEDWIQQHEYLLGVLILIIFFQIINIVYACILMSWVRKSLVDYAWCDEEDF